MSETEKNQDIKVLENDVIAVQKKGSDTPNSETLAAIDDVNNNRNMSKAYDSMDEIIRDLNA